MQRFVIYLISVFLISVPMMAEGEGAHWSYTGDTGPEYWGQLDEAFQRCESGMRQSPVNIVGAEDPEEVTPIQFDYRAVDTSVVNNSHTIQVKYEESESFIRVHESLSELIQFHFHSPSENLIEGESFPLELHFVHQNDTGKITVIAVMIAEGKSNPVLESIWSATPRSPGEKEIGTSLNAADLLPQSGSYYTFRGSLTTPPCTENVEWYVLTEPIEASRAQIDTFVDIIGENNRPAQPLNGRELHLVQAGQIQFTHIEADGSSGNNLQDLDFAGGGFGPILLITGGLILVLIGLALIFRKVGLRILDGFRLRTKIFSMIGMLLVLYLTVSAFSVRTLYQTDDSIYLNLSYNIPIERNVVLSTESHLIQAIWFERALQAGRQGDMAAVRSNEKNFEEYVDHFDSAMNNAIEIAVRSQSVVSSDRIGIYKDIEAKLHKLNEQHEKYTVEARSIIERVKQGDADAVGGRVESLHRLQDRFDKDLENFILEMGEFTEENTIVTRNATHEALDIVIILTIISFVLGILFSLLVTSSILRQLGGEPATLARIAERISRGDLTVELKSDSKENTGLFASIIAMVDKLTSIISSVRNHAESLSSASEEVSSTAQSMSQGSSEQAASVEETSASLEEMTSSITQNARNAAETEKIAVKTATESEEGGQAVEDTVKAMKQIAEKIEIIDEIAYQTNLLALNAAIEAARAGDHGKGFA
ncbi:MAG: carbonic anhydrase family protein, partial [Leptospiraceae bacterium]|nr:carbonic anhydrase family protein [Leptospiraceae bacterium]